MYLLLFNSVWVDLITNFIAGLLASLIFVLVILRLLKPKMIISDKICYKNDEKGDKFFYFKIVNLDIFDAYSCEFELHRRVPYVVDKVKVNHRVTKIELSKPNLYSIPRYKKEIGYGDHAVLVRTFEDLSKDIDTENLEYVLYVSAKHGLSNLTKVSVKTFDNSTVFHSGNFKFGKNIGTC